jgi:hypothetical protein
VAPSLWRVVRSSIIDVVMNEGPDDAHRLERAILELETDGRSPEGALIAADGRRRVFAGWAELGAALEDWRAVARRERLVHRAGDRRPQPTNEGNLS